MSESGFFVITAISVGVISGQLDFSLYSRVTPTTNDEGRQ